MEAMEKDFEDLVESEDDDQEEDGITILDYFDDEGGLIAEEGDSEEEVEETEDSLIADDDTDDDDNPDTITSEEYELFIKEASDEELDALPDEFFANLPDEILEDVELTEEDLPEGETDLQELQKKSLGKRIMSRLKRKKWKTIIKVKGFNKNCMYLDEMNYFLNCIKNSETSFNDIHFGEEVLKTALLIDKSSIKKKELFNK